MMKLRSILYLFTLALLSFACSKTWDDHYSTDESVKNVSLLQQINQTAELSTFYSYLIKTGYSIELASTKNFNVWAPNNQALASIDQSIVSDTAKLKRLIGFYINYNATLSSTTDTRVKMLNGKYTNINLSKSTIEDAVIVSGSGVVCNNGILRTIDKAYLPKENIWELIGQTGCTKLKAFLDGQNMLVFDEEKSKPIGVKEETGQTIYDTAWVWRNNYKYNIADLSSEDRTYTFIALNDNAFEEGENMYSPYFKISDETKKADLTKFNICSDLVVDHKIKSFADTIISTTGVLVSLSPFIITDSIEASNGKIYIVKFFPFNETDKFKPMVIEGENISTASHITWTIRKAEDASNGLDAYLNMVTDASSWLQYNISLPYPAKYEFYWVAVGTTVNLKQYLSLYNYNPGKDDKAFLNFPPLATKKIYGAEVLLGDYTFNEAKQISARLTADPNTTTYITLDYIKIVPVK